MIYGLARVSTAGQKSDGNGLEAQIAELRSKGCGEIFTEQFSGKTTHRPVLEQAIGRLKQGDTLMVVKLDRLARNTVEGIELIKRLFAKGVAVHVLNVGLLEDTPMGQFFITTLLAVAQLEREMIRERTEAGKAIAKQNTGYRG
jgi:DNA invertase Pin-like site-specific DNA recombinase